MKTKEFIKIAPKLAATGLIRAAKKGERNINLGGAVIGSTDRQNEILWRAYGTIENIIVFTTAEKANEILSEHGITEFVAIPTKSGTMCRLFIANENTLKRYQKA